MQCKKTKITVYTGGQEFKHLLYKTLWNKEGRKEMFYLTTHSAHFIYGYMASEETRCRHMDLVTVGVVAMW